MLKGIGGDTGRPEVSWGVRMVYFAVKTWKSFSPVRPFRPGDRNRNSEFDSGIISSLVPSSLSSIKNEKALYIHSAESVFP